MRLITHLHLALSLRAHRAITPIPYDFMEWLSTGIYWYGQTLSMDDMKILLRI